MKVNSSNVKISHSEKLVGDHKSKGFIVKTNIKSGFNPQPDPPRI